MTISIDKLKEIFTADFEKGILYRTKNGKPAGGPSRTGNDTYGNPIMYCRVSVNGKILYTHRVIFALYHGYWPDQVDHLDGNRLNNSISNLVECDTSGNMRNRHFHKNKFGNGVGEYRSTKGNLLEYWVARWTDELGERQTKYFRKDDRTLFEVQSFLLNKMSGHYSDRHLEDLTSKIVANPDFQKWKQSLIY